MRSPVEYEQTDPRWRSVPYTVRPGSGETIGNNGCGPTCAAMVAATLRDKRITPVQAAAWSVEHGYCSAYDGTYWSFFAAYFRSLGIPCEQTGYAATALEAIRAGKMVIVSMGRSIWTTAGHFVLCYGMQDGKILIHDPNSENTDRELATEANFRIGFRQAWIVREDWNVEKREIKIRSTDTGASVELTAILYADENYVRLRDLEKFLPVKIGYDAAAKVPTFNLVYK